VTSCRGRFIIPKSILFIC